MILFALMPRACVPSIACIPLTVWRIVWVYMEGTMVCALVYVRILHGCTLLNVPANC